jgi:pterin-4a-carbinolamine dehydratase
MCDAELSVNEAPETGIIDGPVLDLKAERVAIRLQGMPDWSLQPNGRSIRRARDFKEMLQAEAFAAFVTSITLAQRQPATIDFVGTQVLVTLHAPAGKDGSAGELTEDVLDVAEAIG